MRSIMMLILMAAGMAFLFALVQPVRDVRTTPMLRVSYDDVPRETRSRPSARSVKSGTTERPMHEIKVAGPPRLTKEAADADALELAREHVIDYFSLQTPPDEELVKRCIRDTKDVAGPSIDGQETKIRELVLQFDDSAIQELAQSEREMRMNYRMHFLARILAVAVAALFAVAGYVRLDEWSKGYYSGLLKAVAVLAVVGIGIAAWMR